MARKHEIYVHEVLTANGSAEHPLTQKRFSEILPTLKNIRWQKLPTIKDFETGYIRRSKSPGGNMLFILNKSDLSKLYREWLANAVEMGHTVILTERENLELHHQSLGFETDRATLFTHKGGELISGSAFKRVEVLPH